MIRLMERNPELTFACSQVSHLSPASSPSAHGMLLLQSDSKQDGVGDWEHPMQLQRGEAPARSDMVGAEADLCALAGTAVRVGEELVPWALRTDPGLRGKGAVHSCRRHLGGNGEKRGEPGSLYPPCGVPLGLLLTPEGESRAFAEPVWLVMVSGPRKQQLSAVSSLTKIPFLSQFISFPEKGTLVWTG